MKGKFLFVALSAALLMTACANDEITASRDNSKPYDPNAIQFAPVVPYASRTVATTTDNIEEFITWAVETSGSIYMNGVTVTKGSSTWAPSDQSYYWPDENLTFYSLSPVDYKLYISSGRPDPIDFTVEDEADDQVDFIYAVNVDEAKSESPVPVNFRHALSQIVFKAQNTDTESLKVTIEGVEVDGVAGYGKYTLPGATTAYDDASADTRGTWKVADEHTAKYVALTGAAVELSSDVTDLGTTPLYLIPQTDAGWDNVGDKTNENDGSYFSVSCHLARILETGEEITIWPTDGSDYAYVSVPVAVEWEEGYRYTYTIVFGEGLGYYPPDYSNPDDAGDPIPVLTPISFTVTVDEFQEVEKEVSMEADENGDENTDPFAITYDKVSNHGREYIQNVEDFEPNLDGNEQNTTYDLEDFESPIDDQITFSSTIYTKSDVLLLLNGDLYDTVDAADAGYACVDSEDGVFLFNKDDDDLLSAVEWYKSDCSKYFDHVSIDHSTIRKDGDTYTYVSMTIDGYWNSGDELAGKVFIRNFYNGEQEDGWTETITSDLIITRSISNSTPYESSGTIESQICSLIGIEEMTHTQLHNAGWWTTVFDTDGETLVEQGYYNCITSSGKYLGWFLGTNGYLDRTALTTTGAYYWRVYGYQDDNDVDIRTFRGLYIMTKSTSYVPSGSTGNIYLIYTNGVDKIVLVVPYAIS